MPKKRSTNVYDYDNYRDYISDSLSELGHSQRSFAARYSTIISRVALAKLLASGRGKDKRKAAYNVSIEKLGQLGRALGLSEPELQFLILMKVENDMAILDGQHGASSQRAMKNLLRNVSLGQGVAAIETGKYTGKNTSKNSELEQIYQVLPTKRKQDLLRFATRQLKIHVSRHTGQPGLKSSSNLLRDLEKKITRL